MRWIYLAVLGALIGCQEASQFQVLDIMDGDSYHNYHLTTRSIDTLSNFRNMEGDLGTMRVGGLVTGVLTDDIQFQSTKSIHLKGKVIEDTFYPMDRDGVIALSFYAHLEDIHSFLLDTALDPEPLFPIKMNINPIVPDPLWDYSNFENAAYMSSTHHFLILHDAVEKDVPLAANKGVVGHEFGHGIFHYLTTGNVLNPLPDYGEGANCMYSLNEGFADMVGFLLTKDPAFIAVSLAMLEETRSVQNRKTIEDVASLPTDSYEDSLLRNGYDPYDLGTVFAGMSWDLVESGLSHIEVFNWVTQALGNLGYRLQNQEIALSNTMCFAWMDEMQAIAPTEASKTVFCDSVNARFQDSIVIEGCTQ